MPATANREGNQRLATSMAEHGVEVMQAKKPLLPAVSVILPVLIGSTVRNRAVSLSPPP